MHYEVRTEPSAHEGIYSTANTPPIPDFLRISRSTIDDSITQNLNALVTPSTAGFDPSSTAHRKSSSRRQIEPRACASFKDQVLFPSWASRSEVLAYCGVVATQSDPEASTQAERERKERERVRALSVDERLDPYSARPVYVPESRTERLAAVVRQEQGVEEIVRTRTWGVVRERCGQGVEDWRIALEGWKQENGTR